MELVWIGLGLVAIGAAAMFVFWPWLNYDYMSDDYPDLGMIHKFPGRAIWFILHIIFGLGLRVYVGIKALTGG